LEDVKDCIGALEDRNISSADEGKAALRMIELFLDFCDDEGIILKDDNTSDRILELINDCGEEE
jgi:hypothetical protein